MVAGRHRTGTAVTFLLAAAVATACGGPGDGRVAAALRDPSASPLEQLIVFDTADRATLDQREREAQAAIRACMAEAGFVYVPLDPPGDDGSTDPVEVDPDSLAFATDHGYGMADRARAELAVADVDAGNPADGAGGPGAGPEDPNATARDALTPQGRAAYDRALNGYGPDEIDLSSGRPVAVATGAELTEEEWKEAIGDGCQPTAYAEVFDLATAEATGDLLTALDQELADLEAAFRADPRMVELDGRWAACMAGHGYRLGSREEAVNGLEARYAEILAGAGAGAAATAGPVADAGQRIEDLAAEERALAVADWTCSDDLAAPARAIRREYEVALVEENEGLFIAYLDRIGR